MSDWLEYKKLVVEMIEDNKEAHHEITKELAEIKTEIALLKLKSGLWGGVGGVVVTIIAFFRFWKDFK